MMIIIRITIIRIIRIIIRIIRIILTICSFKGRKYTFKNPEDFSLHLYIKQIKSGVGKCQINELIRGEK